MLRDSISDFAIHMLAPDGTVTSWNDGARQLHGHAAPDILGQSFARFYTAEDQQAGLPGAALAAAARDGRFEADGYCIRADGSRFWAHTLLDAIRGADGRASGFVRIARDLGERLRAEQALIASEEQFRRLVEGVTDYAIYMLSPEGLVSNWNAGAERIKGYKREEIVGQHFSRFYTEEDRARGEPDLALAAARREGRYEREAWRVRKDGSRFLASVVVDAIRDPDGTLLGFAKITRDITERAAAQQELLKAREQLFQSQKLDAIGQLTGGIAHDFNNLLMAVLGSLELARKRLPDDAQLERLVGNAVEAAERGVTLTRRLLAFARRQDLEFRPTDIAGLVGSMTDLMQRALGPGVEIEASFPQGLAPARTDPAQLETAILNLAVNARDAMPNGGRLRITAREGDYDGRDGDLAAGRYVCISVSDEGEGMSAETLNRATEPFFTTKGIGKGTGLGLSMVDGLARQSGGRLTLHSEAASGTTATIWLPAAVAPAAGPEPVAAAAPAAVQAATRPLVIMAVDDDPLVLMNTAAMLEDLGHQVIDVMSGREALDRLGTATVDMVITDHAMPQMNGSQLAHAIRAGWPDMPIVLATGYAELPEGADQQLPRLSKPFTQADLATAVARHARQPRP